MAALRIGATLAYALPTARLHIRCAGRVLVEVRRPPFPEPGLGRSPVVASCAFRRAVASAHQRWSAGERLSFLGLPSGCSPADVATDGDGRTRVGFHRDTATDVTLVHVASPSGDLDAARAAEHTLVGVLGRCLAAELVETCSI